MPSSFVSLAISIGVCVLTFAPYLLNRKDEASFVQFFVKQSMLGQLMVWTVARIVSFPFMESLQAAVAHKLPLVGVAIVAFFGEWLGAALQFYIYDTGFADVVGLRGNSKVRGITSALERQPILFSAALQLSHISKVAPYIAGIGVPCIGNSWALLEVASGTALGQLVNVAWVTAAVKLPWANNEISTLLEPSMRFTVDILLAYWLWQCHRATGAEGAAPAAVKLPRAVTAAAADTHRIVHLGEEPPTSPLARERDEGDAVEAVTPRKRGRPKGSFKKRHSTSATPERRSKTPVARSKTPVARSKTPAGRARPRKGIHLPTVEHRLETALTEHIYDSPTPSTATRRSARLSMPHK